MRYRLQVCCRNMFEYSLIVVVSCAWPSALRASQMEQFWHLISPSFLAPQPLFWPLPLDNLIDLQPLSLTSRLSSSLRITNALKLSKRNMVYDNLHHPWPSVPTSIRHVHSLGKGPCAATMGTPTHFTSSHIALLGIR